MGGPSPLPLPREGSEMFDNAIYAFPLGKGGMGTVNLKDI